MPARKRQLRSRAQPAPIRRIVPMPDETEGAPLELWHSHRFASNELGIRHSLYHAHSGGEREHAHRFEYVHTVGGYEYDRRGMVV